MIERVGRPQNLRDFFKEVERGRLAYDAMQKTLERVRKERSLKHKSIDRLKSISA